MKDEINIPIWYCYVPAFAVVKHIKYQYVINEVWDLQIFY